MTDEKEIEHLRQSVHNIDTQKLIEIEELLYAGERFITSITNLQDLILQELRERTKLLDEDDGLHVARCVNKKLHEAYPQYRYNVFITRKPHMGFGKMNYFLHVEVDVPLALITAQNYINYDSSVALVARKQAEYWGIRETHISGKSTERDNQQLFEAMEKVKAQEEADDHVWSATSFERGYWSGKESK